MAFNLKNDNTTYQDVAVMYNRYVLVKSIRKIANEFGINRQKLSALFNKYGFRYLDNISATKVNVMPEKNKRTPEEIKYLHEKTCLERYGVKNPRQNKEINDKIIASRTKAYLKKLNQKLKDAECEMLEPFTRVQDKDGKYIFYTMKHKCGHIFKTDLRREIKCPKCYYVNRFSKLELKYKSFLLENGVKIEANKKFNGLELDIFCPDYNIGFELNGSYWHSIDKKGKYYHRNKTNHFLEQGILLYQFWDYQKEDIIKSIMLSKLGLSKEKYYARKLKLGIPSVQEEKKFLEDNHLDGYSKSCYRLGLYENENLLSLMTFRHKKGELELCRFVNKINTSVVGGFSKLFKHSLSELSKKFNTDKIITYCNRDISPDYNLTTYNKYGFKFVGDTGCILKYYCKKDNMVYNRQKYQKHKLKDILNQFDEKLTADENLINNNIFPIRNSGNWKYVLERYNK